MAKKRSKSPYDKNLPKAKRMIESGDCELQGNSMALADFLQPNHVRSTYQYDNARTESYSAMGQNSGRVYAQPGVLKGSQASQMVLKHRSVATSRNAKKD